MGVMDEGDFARFELRWVSVRYPILQQAPSHDMVSLKEQSVACKLTLRFYLEIVHYYQIVSIPHDIYVHVFKFHW